MHFIFSHFIIKVFSDEGISMTGEDSLHHSKVLSNFTEKQIEDMEYQIQIKRYRRSRQKKVRQTRQKS